MKFLLFLFLFGVLIQAQFLYAENSMIASAYNQAIHLRFCSSVTGADIDRTGFSCERRKPLELVQRQAWEIFDRNILSESSVNQIAKNECFVAQTMRLKEPGAYATWVTQLTRAWVGLQKANLILDKCQSETSRLRTKANIQKYKFKLEDTIRDSMDPKWRDICYDSAQIAALKKAQNSYLYSLPVLSHRDFFEIMTKHRGAIVNPKNGNPLTDQEILAANLKTDSNFAGLVDDPKLYKDLIEKMMDLSNEREGITKKLRQYNKKDDRDLPGNLKTFMYNEGTLAETLAMKGLMSPQFSTLAESKTETDTDPTQMDKAHISNGGFCLLSKFEPTLVGELIDSGVKTALTAGPLVRLAEGTWLALSTSKSILWAIRAQLLSAAIGVCKNDLNEVRIMKSALQGQDAAFKNAEALPAELGYLAEDLDFGDIPACKAAKDKNLIQNRLSKPGCVVNFVTSFAPLEMALPLIVIPRF